MTDPIVRLLEQARADALRDVRPPGPDEVRRTVRRRRGIVAGIGTAVAVAGIAAAGALAVPPSPGAVAPGADSSAMPSQFPVMPEPDPATLQRMAVASAALGDWNTTPWVMATDGVVSADYQNFVNDIPAGTYDLHLYCVGEGKADVVVKADRAGDDKLAAGSVTCAADPKPARLTVRQPVHGYLRMYLSGDEKASGTSAFSFKFVRADPTATAGPDTTANAGGAAALLAGATPVTTERDKTVEKPLGAGNHLVSFACKGPGTLAFTVRSAGVLRDGTVATTGRTELAVDKACSSAENATVEVPITLPADSAITITAAADDAARDKAGWAYTIRPA
ncbi:hypothetical protein QLQ12_17220 [Actinoplanes sp. NEAU-A12]|uniref:Uncharacterized protein n=1 Tax=Actinoplanes sandaracinus TaxID=3045177 RepID=A0ABT6WKT2_9ACTN|nr:hypothetical protein [Actinoplanes sandaracinus]MDI6100350.1 hypothetical protein [Actinoplanes sandaracinus]